MSFRERLADGERAGSLWRPEREEEADGDDADDSIGEGDDMSQLAEVALESMPDDPVDERKLTPERLKAKQRSAKEQR